MIFFTFLRSSALNLYIPLVTIVYGCIGAPLIFFKSKKIFNFSKAWADAVLFGAKFFCNISYQVENNSLQPKTPCIIASKHQSFYECLIFLSLFPGVCFVLKKELLKIPIFGSYLKALKMIVIDRSKMRESIQIINKETLQRIEEEKRFVLIFPESTRMGPDEKSNCKSGVVFLHKANISNIVPAWVNSGKFWGRNSFLKFPGIVKLQFFDSIDRNADSKSLPQKINEIFDNTSKSNT